MTTEPGTSPDEAAAPFDVRDSNPNSSGEPGLSGDLGVSSERTGPSVPGSFEHGIAGTEAKGDASGRTDGAFDTSPQQWDAPDVSQGSRGQALGRTDRAEELEYVEGSDGPNGDGAGGTSVTGIDRTVGGEPNSLPLGGDKNHR